MCAHESHGHLPGSLELRRLNLAMVAAGIAAFGALYSTQALMPALSAAFDTAATSTSLTVSAGTGTLALTVVPLSIIADRVGRARVMRIGMSLIAVLILLSAAAPTLSLLIATRALLGVAVGAVAGVAMGHVGAEVHSRAVGAAMGLYVAGNSIGGVSGRFVSGVVEDLAGWRWSQVAVGLMCIAALGVFWLNLPPSRERAYRQSAATELLAPLRDPRLRTLYLVPFLLMGGFVATYNYLTYRLESPPFELPSSLVALVFFAYFCGALGSIAAGRLADRFGRPPIVFGGIVVMLAGLGTTLADWLVTIVLGTVILTTGFFIAHSAASGWVPVLSNVSSTIASSYYVLAYYAGSSVFGAAIGFAWTHGGWSGTVVAVGILTLGAVIALLLLVTQRRRPA